MFEFFRNQVLWQNVSWLGIIFQGYYHFFGDKRLYEVFLEDLRVISVAVIFTGILFLTLNITEIIYARKTNRLIHQISDDFATKLELTLIGVRDLLEKDSTFPEENSTEQEQSYSDGSISDDSDPVKNRHITSHEC